MLQLLVPCCIFLAAVYRWSQTSFSFFNLARWLEPKSLCRRIEISDTILSIFPIICVLISYDSKGIPSLTLIVSCSNHSLHIHCKNSPHRPMCTLSRRPRHPDLGVNSPCELGCFQMGH